MKTSILLKFTIIIGIILLGLPSGRIRAQSSSPSLSETLEFLKGKLASTHIFSTASFSNGEQTRSTHMFEYTPIRFEGSTFQFKEIDSTIKRSEKADSNYKDESRNKWIHIYTIDLKHIAVSSIKVTKLEGYMGEVTSQAFKLRMNTLNDGKLISRRKIYGRFEYQGGFGSRYQGEKTVKEETNEEERDKLNSFSFYFDDEEIANRCAKALKHAVELSGGKKEPF